MLKDNFIVVLILMMLTAIFACQMFILSKVDFGNSLNLLAIAGHSSEISENVKAGLTKKE